MGQGGDIKKNKLLELDGDLFKVIDFSHSKTARQAGMVKTKMQSLLTGATIDKTWRLTETFTDATTTSEKMTFSYIDGDEYAFMNMETYEEARLSSDLVVGRQYLKEGDEIEIKYWNGKPIDVQIPKKVILEITIGGAGKDPSRTTAGKKSVTVETGAVISGVPMFVETGEMIEIDTETGAYLGRANKKDRN
jgi:elongation factor P